MYSIANLQNFHPAVSAAFNTGCTPGCTATSCSCTQSSYSGSIYWSSSSNAGYLLYAWGVDFYYGGGNDGHKAYYGYVRAVRGGP